MKRLPIDTSMHIGKTEKHAILFNRQAGRCWYCGDRLATVADLVDGGLCRTSDARWPQIEHQIPRSKGGGNRLSNLVLACVECNHEKGDWTVEEYRGRLAVGLLDLNMKFHGERS